jgi:signal transduction histidine kinase
MRGESGPGNHPCEDVNPTWGGEKKDCHPTVSRVVENNAGSMSPSTPLDPETEKDSDASRRNAARVLVVNGGAKDRGALSSILRREGYRPETATSGEEAYALIRGGGFDLAFIGATLPDDDGIALIWPLKEIRPDLAVIMTGDSRSRETSIRALNEGAWAYIATPPHREELLATVRQAQERQMLIRENASLAASAKRETSRRERAERELRNLEGRIADYTAREQERIGQELHDVLGQQLTDAGLIAKSIQNRVGEKGARDLREDIGELIRAVQEGQEEVRRLAKGLCGARMDSRGLMLALDDLVISATRRTGIEVFLECDGDTFIHDALVSNHLYYIAQEAVSNAIRHGKPGRIVVVLKTENGRISLEVRDDGIGFAGERTGKQGMGLRIMRYRAERVGARFSIRSSPTRGTTVSCTLSERRASV